MSIFDETYQSFADKQTAKATEKATAVASELAEQSKFRTAFTQVSHDVARPIFEKCASDSIKHGYDARVESGIDGNENPFIAIRLMPVLEKKLGGMAHNESAFYLTGIVSTQKVGHHSYYDVRNGRHGLSRPELGIGSVRAEVLERHLVEFVNASLESRSKFPV